jgi:hypothetical protein
METHGITFCEADAVRALTLGVSSSRTRATSQPSAFDHIRRKWEALNPRKMD